MSDRRYNKPTLEELLQLKRAERPDAEFWAGFDRELRQKQLTALVEKRRWWHELSVLLGRRVYLPAGAAAVVAFSLVAVRLNGPSRIAGTGEHAATRMEVADQTVEILPATVVASPQGRYEEPIDVADQSVVSEGRPEATEHRAVSVAARDEISPSARSIAANLARLEQSEPELINAVMGSRLGAAGRVQTAAYEADEDPMMAPPAASPRYRLIARYADRSLSPEPSAPAMVRERIARRLGDGLVDDVSRFGVGGNRVSLKF